MFFKFTQPYGAALLLAAPALSGASAMQAQNMAHEHMGHVSDAWGDAPDGKGLLPIATEEAEHAYFHAREAVKYAHDLNEVILNAQHVLHMVDPSEIERGMGLGYGVKRAAAAVAEHIGFAAEADDATENVKLHAVHVATCANNTVDRIAEIVGLANSIRAAKTAAEAAPAALELRSRVNQLMEGRDANGDGTVTWHEGEGGLRMARLHMRFMREGEDL